MGYRDQCINDCRFTRDCLVFEKKQIPRPSTCGGHSWGGWGACFAFIEVPNIGIAIFLLFLVCCHLYNLNFVACRLRSAQVGATHEYILQNDGFYG